MSCPYGSRSTRDSALKLKSGTGGPAVQTFGPWATEIYDSPYPIPSFENNKDNITCAMGDIYGPFYYDYSSPIRLSSDNKCVPPQNTEKDFMQHNPVIGGNQSSRCKPCDPYHHCPKGTYCGNKGGCASKTCVSCPQSRGCSKSNPCPPEQACIPLPPGQCKNNSFCAQFA